MQDVAAAAGVSIATVSRAINEPHRVSAATRERVEAAMGALGYAVNTAGRSLAGGATGNVGVLMFVPPGSTRSDVFFMELLRGIELSLRDTSLAVLVSILPCDRTQKDRKSTRLNSSHANISYAVFCLKKKETRNTTM